MTKATINFPAELETGEDVISVKSPFKLHRDKKRRYIRMEISEPIEFNVLVDSHTGFNPSGGDIIYHGSILNISAGGVLMTCENPLEEGTVILVKLVLQDVELLQNIIGVVKRCDVDEKGYLIGFEFITSEYLVDHLSQAELEMLPENIASFDEQLRKVLNKYVYRKRIEVV